MDKRFPKDPVTRRTLLRMALPLAVALRSASTRAIGTGASQTPQPSATTEGSAGLTVTAPDYPSGNVLRYGIVANDPGAASANSAILAKILHAITGLTGLITFPNSSGKDVYYFNGIAYQANPAGVSIELNNSRLEFAKTYNSGTDDAHGFIEAIANFEIRNGAINVNYTGSGGENPGPIFRLGSRYNAGGGYAFGKYTHGVLDEDMGVFMGKLTLRNLALTSNNPAAPPIWITGGVDGLLAEDLRFHGSSRPMYFIAYEFGFASTNGQAETLSAWSSSHARNMVFRNINVSALSTSGTDGAAIDLAGAYDCLIDGLTVDAAFCGVHIRSGEALGYRPSSRDIKGMKPAHITLRNIKTQNIKSNAITLQGDELATHNYLRKVVAGLGHPADYVAQTDLINFSVDGFELSAAGAGIYLSGRGTVQNGKTVHCGSGLIISDECMRFDVSKVTIINSTGTGIRANFGNAIWSPPRKKSGSISDCKIAGNTGPGIVLDNCDGVTIERNQLGFNTAQDGVAETTQTQGVSLGPSAFRVSCNQNRTTCKPGAAAYNSTNVAANAMNRITGEGITRTVSGAGHFVKDF